MKKNYKNLTFIMACLGFLILSINSFKLKAQAPVVQTFSYTGSIVNFTVPSCVATITMEAWGAQGGSIPTYPGGLGAYMSGVFTVTAGQVLRVLVGGQGGDIATTPAATGGGGGSFVALIPGVGPPVPWLVAGGGGGRRNLTVGPAVNSQGQVGMNGMNSFDNTGAGGSNGNGGLSGEPAGNGTGGPGGGFLTNGGPCGVATPPTPGFAFVNGGGIAPTCSPFTSGTSSFGGFGGGGGGCWCFRGTPGGGGGYSGGGAGINDNAGGGGGSFNLGTSQSNSVGVQSGNGQVRFTYNFNGAGVLATMSNTAGLCAGGNLTLTASNVPTFTWSTGSNNTSIVVSPSVTTSFTVQGTNTLGCVSSAVLNVSINPLPTLTTAVTPTILCVGSTATVSAIGAQTYTWSTGAVGQSAPVSPSVSTSYTVTGTSTAGCINSFVVPVNVNTITIPPIPAATICAGQTASLTATGAVSYVWSNGSPFATAYFAPATSTVYSVNALDIYNCPLSATAAVIVNPKPLVNAGATKTLICKGESTTLNASGGNNYSWSNGANGPSQTITPPLDVLYGYTVTVTDNNNCSNTAAVYVKVERCTSIFERTTLDKIEVYPNPNNGIFNVVLPQIAQNSVIIIYDLLGKVVKQQNAASEISIIDMQNEPRGVYVIKVVENGKTTHTTKMVKQ